MPERTLICISISNGFDGEEVLAVSRRNVLVADAVCGISCFQALQSAERR